MSLELGRRVVLEAEGLALHRGPDCLLRGVALAVEEGAWLGILDVEGRTGQVLLDVLSGRVRPQSGLIRLAGVPIQRLPARARIRLGLARSFSASPPLACGSVGAMLVQAMRLVRHPGLRLLAMGKPQPAEWRRAGEVLSLFALEERLEHPLTALPLYERQCVEIARLIALNCRVLLLDRPFRGLSVVERERLATILTRFRDSQWTVLLLEDDGHALAELCERIVVFSRGRLLAEGTPEQIGNRLDLIRLLIG